MKKSIRIMISEPAGLTKINLFGHIISERGNTIIVQLGTAVSMNNESFGLIKLKPIHDKTFKKLDQYYAVHVEGMLLNDDNSQTIYTLAGVIAID